MSKVQQLINSYYEKQQDIINSIRKNNIVIEPVVFHNEALNKAFWNIKIPKN